MIHITEQQVRETLTMAKAIELLEDGFRRLGQGRAVNHPRRRVRLENGAMLHYMAAGDNDSGFLGGKVYATNPRTGAHFVVLLFDPSGSPAATIEADLLGQVRTGAASGVATRYMARKEAATLGMIGSGYQARSQLEAVAEVRKLSRARVYSRSAENRGRFAREMSERLGLAIDPVDSAEKAVREADIVVTITNSRQPVLEGEWLPAGCHVNAAGSNRAKRREIDARTMERAAVIAADSVEQAKIEAGDLIQAADEGRLDWGKVSELSAIISGRIPGRTSDQDITLFESQGLAIEDLAAAEYVYQQVRG